VTLRVSPPPATALSTFSSKTAQGFDVIRLVVPKNLEATGSIQ
jgi:hypothetical protein